MARNNRQACSGRCPICGSDALRRDVQTRRLDVVCCAVCQHRVARHAPDVVSSGDYHEQYAHTELVRALEPTRRRQARRILQLVRRNAEGPLSLLDFGAGRGWLLDEARRAGIARLSGADTSRLAVQLLNERRFEAVLLPDAAGAALPSPTFHPRVLTALDVIEHFPSEEVQSRLARLLEHFHPELVVLKVPLAGGLLYRGARALAACGAPAALEQLYQVGTSPPHFSYFSRESLLLLLRALGLELLEAELELDFDAAELGRRARVLRHLGPAAIGLGAGLALTARLLDMQDSLIVVARVSARAPS